MFTTHAKQRSEYTMSYCYIYIGLLYTTLKMYTSFFILRLISLVFFNVISMKLNNNHTLHFSSHLHSER